MKRISSNQIPAHRGDSNFSELVQTTSLHELQLKLNQDTKSPFYFRKAFKGVPKKCLKEKRDQTNKVMHSVAEKLSSIHD
jgi:hypothetical protein